MLVLSLNSGSSSIKYQLFDLPRKKDPIRKGILERIGSSAVKNHRQAIKILLKRLGSAKPAIIGHRVVHGGDAAADSALIDDKVLKVIKRFSDLAPLHNPPALACIVACRREMPGLPQVAVFDTAFHQTIPDYAYIYGIPFKYYQKYRIRRYGFHGTSHRYVAEQAAVKLKRGLRRLKLITCHLGNGASISAVRYGKSIDNSMGLTPLEGVMMGTRSGDIDPGAIIYLAGKERLGLDKLNELLNHQSGLLGLSGISNDMRDIEKARRHNHRRARLAQEVFCYRIKKYIGAYLAVLGGCDAIVFTGGIGENCPRLIKKIIAGIDELLDGRRTRILTVPTNEEFLIAGEAYRVARRAKS